ncbi:hypothetical protein HBI21_053840 [Parastagonospora nodorum]|nr:hypothetical protein HBH72_107390 [Parastagonospora nodorum]KAH5193189.1 hypothetical protein HBH76_064940 [Parastagonospora nodorum]KAH5681603.1 hypothetical protein HBI21_053840 [Parastagonospora nodorum]
METPARISKRTMTKYDAQFYSEVFNSSLGMPTPPTSTANDDTAHANKRRRLTPPMGLDTPCISSREIQFKRDTSYLSTPPETMSLRVTIPEPVVTKDDQRALAIRRAAARRWIPKLQGPFPKRREIGEAYKLKLMRHYTSPTTSSEPNFIKPHIDVSPRVDRLRQRFPKVLTSIPKLNLQVPGPMACAPPKATQGRKSEENNMQLKMNKNITKSEAAQRLAWKSFSATERDRIDRGREAMMESGLMVDDLNSEQRGTKNGLPEWRKKNTGKFAREKRNAI